MRSACALYLDAGYFLSASAQRVTGTSYRAAVRVDHARLIAALIEAVEQHCGLPLVRVSWYDAAASGNRLAPDQLTIADLPRVKLRLGRLSVAGDQKGVDVRLALDLVMDAQGPTVDVAYLVTGDGDLTEAVEEAQRHGTSVHLLVVPDSAGAPAGVSRHLRREVDELVIIDEATIDSNVVPVQRPTSPSAPATGAPSPADLAQRRPASSVVAGAGAGAPEAAPPQDAPLVYSTSTGSTPTPVPAHLVADDIRDDAIDDVARLVFGGWLLSASEGDQHALLRSRPSIPPAIDRTLLIDLSTRLGLDDLNDDTRIALRAGFWRVVDAHRNA